MLWLLMWDPALNEICPAYSEIARTGLIQPCKKRDLMISVGFERVIKKRPCWICGKPNYYGFSRDEGTSICMRISAGSRGLSCTVEISTSILRFHSARSDQQFRGRLANQFCRLLLKLEVLFFKLIKDLARFKLHGGTCRCPGGLLSRGLLEYDATRYGALPRTKQERAVLAGILDDYVRAHFPCCCFGVVRYVVRLSLLTVVFAELGNLYEGQKCKPK